MNFLIITHVPHIYQNKEWYGYAPYVREMNIWLKYVDEVTIVSPVHQAKPSAIDMAYQQSTWHINMSRLLIKRFLK